MALPVYRRRGIMYADLPRVETANLQESARSFETINRRLDQLQSFIKKEGTEYAQEQALAYAAQNPVTQEQIDEARSTSGQEQSWLSALTGGNVYQETLKEAQGSLLANKLSVEATSAFNRLQIAAETGQIEFDDIQNEVNDLIDGYTTTIAAFSPTAANKSRASMAADGNRILDAVAKKRVEAILEAKDAQFNDNLFQHKRAITDEYARGDTFDPNTQTYTLAEDRALIKRDNLILDALSDGNEDKVDEIYKMHREARIAGAIKIAASNEFADNPARALLNFQTGKMGKAQSLWDSMDDDERNEVIKGYFNDVDREAKVNKAIKDQEDKLLTTRAFEIRDLIEDAPEASDDPNIKTIDELIDEARDVNLKLGKSEFTRKELEGYEDRDFNSNEADDDTMADIEERILFKFENKDPIDEAEIKKMAEDDIISGSQRRSLLKLLRGETDKKLKREEGLLKDDLLAIQSPNAPAAVKKKQQKIAIINMREKYNSGVPLSDARREAVQEISTSAASKKLETKVNALKEEVRSRSGAYYEVYKSLQATETPEQVKQREKLIQDSGVLRKFGAPGLGIKGLPEQANIYGIAKGDIPITEEALNKLIDVLVENETLIDQYVENVDMQTFFHNEIRAIKELMMEVE